MSWLDEMVAPLSMGRILGQGAVGTLAPLVGTTVAVGWGDVALLGASAMAGVATVTLGVAKHRLASLPLEVSPRAAVSIIDGVRVARARACLGRGRACRPTVEAWWVMGESRRALEPLPLPERVVGPMAVSVVLPDEPGVLEVRWTVTERGRPFVAERRYEALEEGHFAAGIAGRPVRFEGDWGAVRPVSPEA